MTLEPLLTASLAVKLHVAAVLPAAAIGAYQLARPKGTPSHFIRGYLFTCLMLTAAAASFFIRNFRGGFTWIHIFIPITVIGLAIGLWNVRHGNIIGHKRSMTGLYIGAIGIAGLLTLLPGRIMHQVFFGP